MSINDDDPLLKLHESLKKETDEVKPEDNTVSISSDGEVHARNAATSLKEALQTLVKYAKMLEEADDKVVSEKVEADVPDKD